MREFAKSTQNEKRWIDAESGSHRTEHGGVAWATASGLIQPQDGAIDVREGARVTDISTRSQLASLGAIAMGEPEDAGLTGSTRSLVRRMLGLNIAPRAARSSAPAVMAKSVKPVKALIATGQVRVA
jgi:hypothetical protein